MGREHLTFMLREYSFDCSEIRRICLFGECEISDRSEGNNQVWQGKRVTLLVFFRVVHKCHDTPTENVFCCSVISPRSIRQNYSLSSRDGLIKIVHSMAALYDFNMGKLLVEIGLIGLRVPSFECTSDRKEWWQDCSEKMSRLRKIYSSGRSRSSDGLFLITVRLGERQMRGRVSESGGIHQ